LKIRDFKTFVVGNPPPHFGGRYWIFLKLTTDSGIVGIGEAYSIPFHPNIVENMIGDVCERCVIGSDPFKIERLWRIIYGSGFTLRPDTSIMGILSAIEMFKIVFDLFVVFIFISFKFLLVWLFSDAPFLLSGRWTPLLFYLSRMIVKKWRIEILSVDVVSGRYVFFALLLLFNYMLLIAVFFYKRLKK